MPKNMWTFQPSAWKLNSLLSTNSEYPPFVIALSFGHIAVEIPNPMCQGFDAGIAISENLIYILKKMQDCLSLQNRK